MPPRSTFHQSSTQPEWRSCALTASKRLRQSSTPWNSGKLMRHCASLRSLPHDSTCAVGAMMCNVKHTGAACGSISRHGLHLVSCPWQLRKHWERCSFLRVDMFRDGSIHFSCCRVVASSSKTKNQLLKSWSWNTWRRFPRLVLT